MTQTPKRKYKAGDPVMMPSGLVTEITDIQYEHNRYQIAGVSGWQYGIEHLQPASWKAEALKWREEALRQYPTPEAYEGVCAALEKHRTRADAAEAREQQSVFTYAELLAIWDGLNSLPRNTEIQHAGEKVSVDELKKKVESVASTLYPDTPAPTAANTEQKCHICGDDPAKMNFCSAVHPTPAPKEGE
ncbi:hypothetical protein [Paenibacillus typhae]|uniref:hypothetical protein n=1 Tax=Paenibacillus typhae TaxID=1174501 RepID=UPI001C8D7DE7|nr:hypothetical protein [Paenibacillus typhae]MBY0011481.1 hypothetical protein [Paenibacillus typhae]